jgi:hypothetical protein
MNKLTESEKGYIAGFLDGERDETLEAWRLKWEGLAKGFMNYLQDRFASIEQRLEKLEQLEEERHGCQKD